MPRWFLWTLLAVISWGLWAALSKLIGSQLSAAQSQALSTIGLLPVMIGLASSRRLSSTGRRWRGIALAFAAGILTCLGNTAYYQALTIEKAATVVPLTALYPLVTIALAVPLLKEKLNRFQICGILLALAAIYLFNVPGEKGLVSPALAYALAPVALWGIAGFLQKLSTNEISGELSTLAFLTAFVPVALLLLSREPIAAGTVVARTWLLVASLGLFFALGNFAILEAFARNGKASIIAPLAGLYPVVSVPIAILLLGERIGPRETAGIALALASVTALSYDTQQQSATSGNGRGMRE